MQTGIGGIDWPAVLRAIPSIVVAIGGLFVARKSVHRRRRVTRNKKAPTISSGSPVDVGISDRQPSSAAPAYCLHCGRSDRRIRAFGCGDLKEREKCLMLSRWE